MIHLSNTVFIKETHSTNLTRISLTPTKIEIRPCYPICMETTMMQNIFVTNGREMETLDELHLYLLDYVHILEKRLKALKKEVKENPTTKTELKGQM